MKFHLTPNNIGATKIKANSMGSVIPVSILVRAADKKRLLITFFDSSLALRYIAKAAPMLFVVDVFLAGTAFVLAHVLKVTIGFTFSCGLIDFLVFGV